MRMFWSGVIVLCALSAGAARAQEPASETTDGALPVSLDRIKRQLDRLPESRNERSLLRLNYYIDVYGRAPEINVIDGFDLDGPLSYGAPTHREMVDAVTPRHWIAPGLDLSSLIGWGGR